MRFVSHLYLSLLFIFAASAALAGDDSSPKICESGFRTIGVVNDGNQKPSKKIFTDQLGDTFLEGEQKLQGTTPLLSHPGNMVGKLFPSFGLLKNIPLEYQPAEGAIYEINALHLPSEKMDYYASKYANKDHLYSIFHPIGDSGKPDLNIGSYYTHPLDNSYIQSMLPDFQTTKLWATTTSSGRTLGVLEPSGSVEMLKLSLHDPKAALGGFIPKVNGRARIEKAVALSDALHEFHEETNGALPLSGKRWEVMEEIGGAIPKGDELGGYIIRDYKPVLKPDEELLTWYAIFSKRSNGQPTWFNELYKKSGYTSKLEFAWNELVKPLVELHTQLAFENDFATQLHQQNTLIRFNRNTGKISTIVFRDVEGMSVGYSIRTHVMKKPPILISGGFDKSVAPLEFAHEANLLASSYTRKLRMESIQWAFQSVLDPLSMSLLKRRADNLVIEQFNIAFPHNQIQSISQMEKVLVSLQASVETVEEKAAYASQRGSKDLKYIKMMKRILKKKDHYTTQDQLNNN